MLAKWRMKIFPQNKEPEEVIVTSNCLVGAISTAYHSWCYLHGSKYRDIDGVTQVNPSRHPIDDIQLIGINQ